MLHTSPDPENDPLPPDEFDRLEDLFQRIKEKGEAWRRLLDSLEDLKQKNTPNTTKTNEPPTPST